MVKKNICVFCGSMKGNNSIYCSEAKKLGSIISKNKWNLIFGGGKQGLMGAIAKSFDASQADIISIIPNNKAIYIIYVKFLNIMKRSHLI